MRLVLISDTHGLDDRVPKLPQGDILVHAGDFMNAGQQYGLLLLRSTGSYSEQPMHVTRGGSGTVQAIFPAFTALRPV